MIGACSLVACERPAPPSSVANESPLGAPTTLPTYTFSPGLREQHPDVVAFVQKFLETCLAGDYAGYRQLVSRARQPQSRERFLAIYHGLSRVEVESIAPVRLPGVETEAFRVISTVHVHSEQARAALRGEQRRLAIVVLLEAGQYAMLPAPADLQPHDQQPATDEARPAEGPDYPWDQNVDY